MHPVITSGFRSELMKFALVRGFIEEISKIAGFGREVGNAVAGQAMWTGAKALPVPLLGAAAINAGAIGLIGAAAKPKEITWRSWFRMPSNRPLAFQPQSIANTPISDLHKQAPGGF